METIKRIRLKIKDSQIIVNSLKTTPTRQSNDGPLRTSGSEILNNATNAYTSKRSSIQIEGGLDTVSRFSKMVKTGGLAVCACFA